jgi:hypothetical protein
MLPSGASFARSGAPSRAPGSAASRAAAAPGEIRRFRLGKYEETLGTCREHIRKHVENVGLISETYGNVETLFLKIWKSIG